MNISRMESEIDSAIDDKKDTNLSEKMSKKALKRLIRKEKQLEKKKNSIDFNFENDNISTLQLKYDLILEKHLAETDYYFENGLRKVYPYYFNYAANAKGRWFNKKIVDIFCTEMQGYTEERCHNILKNGLLKVNNTNINSEYIIKNGDIINNYVHRHELPVSDEKIEIMFEDESVLIVNKPSSIPMHPCGRYRHNSLLYILAKEYGYKRLHTIHRIDRLTSGLVIFCKNEYKAKRMAKCIVNRTVKKEYICKVDGIFPSDVIECIEPIDAMCSKNGVYKVHPNGKYSKTVFEKLASNEDTSIVKCTPLTGRTHQIRVHLQYLGFPIINDPLYNNPSWGIFKGKDGKFCRTDEEVIKDLMKIHSSNLYLSDEQIYNIDNLQPQCNNKHNIFNLEREEDSNINSENYLIKLTETALIKNIEILNEKVILNSNDGLFSKQCQNSFEDINNLEEKVVDNVPIKRQKFNSDISSLTNNGTLSTRDNTLVISDQNNSDNIQTKNLSLIEKESDIRHGLLSDCKVRNLFDADCIECQKVYKDPTKDQLTMYLHAVKYEGPDWSYSTPVPDWAIY